VLMMSEVEPVLSRRNPKENARETSRFLSNTVHANPYPWPSERSSENRTYVGRHVPFIHLLCSFHESMQCGHVIFRRVLHVKVQVLY
jgi:hypothetical protein